MPRLSRASCLLIVYAGSCIGCSGLLFGSPARPESAVPLDPTPSSKCHVAANASHPLVTEWPASEKSHLQNLLAYRAVAVEYSGCDLRIVDGCELEGTYTWRRTTLATDTLEIANADELYAKLPIGAFGLEGELQRSGRLAVNTTVAGQLRIDRVPREVPATPACGAVTHVIAAISVGAFRLLSGSNAGGGIQADSTFVNASARAKRSESVLREAGNRSACDETREEAPNGQCASPIQLFLSPIAPRSPATASAAGTGSSEATPGLDGMAAPNGTAATVSSRPEGAVRIHFPASEDPDETWTLRRPGGRLACQLPCSEWIGPANGYYLQREPRNGTSAAKLDLPASFPHPVGSHIDAEFQTGRGNTTLSGLAMWGAVPAALMGTGLVVWGIVQSTRTCADRRDGECFPNGGFLIGAGAMDMALGAAGIWWYFWSRDERFVTRENLTSNGSRSVTFGLGRVSGTF